MFCGTGRKSWSFSIHRNELGHRYYTGYDIQLIPEYKRTEEAGAAASCNQKTDSSDHGIHERVRRKWGSVAGRYYRGYIGRGTEQVAKEGADTKQSTDTAKAEICNNEKILEFQTILERLIAQELQFSERG